jgi:hypothetical protein
MTLHQAAARKVRCQKHVTSNKKKHRTATYNYSKQHLAEQRVVDRHEATLTDGSAGLPIEVQLWVLQICETAGREKYQQRMPLF